DQKALASRFTGVGLVACFVLATAVALGLIQFRVPLMELFTRDAEVIELGARLVFLLGSLQVFDGLQVVGAGALRGLALTTGPFLAHAVALWGIGAPLAYWLGPASAGGVTGVWLGLV